MQGLKCMFGESGESGESGDIAFYNFCIVKKRYMVMMTVWDSGRFEDVSALGGILDKIIGREG